MDNAIKKKWNNLHIIDAASAAVIFDLKIPAGPLFRFVYLDYTAVWSGNRSKKPLCVPEEETIQLFDRRRFYNRSVLALTLTKRDRVYGDSMIPTVWQALTVAAKRNKYRIKIMHKFEYQSETRANMVLMYGLVEAEHLPKMQINTRVEEVELAQVRTLKVSSLFIFAVF
jgi:hypothetical protein